MVGKFRGQSDAISLSSISPLDPGAKVFYTLDRVTRYASGNAIGRL